MKEIDELIVGPACSHGYRDYRRRRSNGSIEAGTLGPPDMPFDEGQGVLEMQHVEGNHYEVLREIKFTARSHPATDAYRSGWDGCFGKKRAACPS